jgi:hypothetical protein
MPGKTETMQFDAGFRLRTGEPITVTLAGALVTEPERLVTTTV